MAKLKKVLKGQSVTEQIDLINENVESVNTDLEKVVNNENGYITADDIPVKKVNGKTGDVSLSASDVGAFPNHPLIQELDINNLKETGVYVGYYGDNTYYLIVIKHNSGYIYQELIGVETKQYRRFTGGQWQKWEKIYSTENPVKAGDVKGINVVDTDTELTLALLENGTFVKADIKYNPSTKSLYVGSDKFATEEFVRNAVNTIKSIIVTELPAVGVENTIYFVPNTTVESKNSFNEYVYINGKWEVVGGTTVDLTPFLEKEVAEKTYAKISALDEKVSKTTTINGKTLYNNIILTAEDVGALPSDTKLSGDVVYRNTNAEIVVKLGNGEFVENDVVLATDTGTYKQGHIYRYNESKLTDITDTITDYVALTGDQSIAGTKNFTGILRYGGVSVATTDDIKDVEDKLPTIDSAISTTSTNPVQNKAITTELNKKANQSALDDLSGKVDLKVSKSYVDEEIEKVENKIPNTSNFVTKDVNDLTNYKNNTQLTSLLAEKQGNLTETQLQAVNSGATSANIGQISTNTQAITTINNKIPAQASSTNQLADKEFVNSTVSTATATFRGTFNTLAELQAVTADENDYGFVKSTDSAGNTVYKRYKYSNKTWMFEYDLNNSSFTAEQWASINSGITATEVEKINNLSAEDISCVDNSGSSDEPFFENVQGAIDATVGAMFQIAEMLEPLPEQVEQNRKNIETIGNEASKEIKNIKDTLKAKVDYTTTINGKALSTNINLDASDVGAMPSDEPVLKYGDNVSPNLQEGEAVFNGTFMYQNNPTGMMLIESNDQMTGMQIASMTGQQGSFIGVLNVDETGNGEAVNLTSNGKLEYYSADGVFEYEVPKNKSGTFALTADIPNTSSFITKDVNNLTNYKNNTQLTSLLNEKQNKITSSSKLSNTLVSGLGTASTVNTGTSSGNVPVLGTDGKLPSSVIPASAITNTFVASSESGMLSFATADVGDVCVRTDVKKTFILKATPYSTLSNWQELLTPTDAVTTVNGQTGHVILTAEDIGALPSNTEIPKINSGTLYFEKNGGIIGSFTNNQDYDSYFDISMPKDTLYYGEMDLNDDQKAQARLNIGAGTSNFSGYFQDLQRLPSLVNSIDGATGHITGIAKTSDLSNYLPKSGGTLTGTVQMTAGDMIAQYVAVKSAGHETGTYDKIATLSSAGYIRYRSKAELKSDLGVPTLVTLTQAEYDALATKDTNTYYFIKEE